MEPSRFVDGQELVGRTVAKVHLPALNGTTFSLLFTDGTYTSVHYSGGYYPGEGEMTFEQLCPEEIKALDEQREPFSTRWS